MRFRFAGKMISMYSVRSTVIIILFKLYAKNTLGHNHQANFALGGPWR